MPPRKKKISSSYEDALAELQQIVADMENEAVGVDTLAEKVQRAAELVHFCQQKLRTTDETVQETLKSIG